MREISTYGSIKDGKLEISYRNKFVDLLRAFNNCRVEVIVRKLYKKRSNEQNRYYWGVIIQAYIYGAWNTQARWITGDQAHLELKFYCNGKDYVNDDGEVMRFPESTRKHTTVEQELYYDKCRAFIFDWFGETVPLPNEQGELDFTAQLRQLKQIKEEE